MMISLKKNHFYSEFYQKKQQKLKAKHTVKKISVSIQSEA